MRGRTAPTIEIDVTDTAPRFPPSGEADSTAAPTTPAADSDAESAADLYLQIAAAIVLVALLLAR